jgi:hypothetical protein
MKEGRIYCKYCGATLKKDFIGKKCGTRNCQWEFGMDEEKDETSRREKSYLSGDENEQNMNSANKKEN